MKRRQNFLLGSTATYEVRVYPYGKKNVRDDRNVKVRKFSGVRAAMDWAKVNLAYPEVEVVDLTSGRTVFAGGTGKTFNPRKKRKTPKRRDVYAEMAKSRKTTKGHKRKDRKRSVARGSSRKPKHKIRLNPFEYEKPNLGAKVFDANVKKRQSKILGMYRGFLAALGSAGVKKLPSAGEIRDDAMQGAVLIESTRYPELRSQSKEAGGAQAVAAEVLGVGPGGEFAAYVQDYPEIFELHLKDTVELLRKERKKLRAAERKDAKRIDKAREDFTQERATSKAAQIAAIEAKIEAKKSEIADYGDEDYEDEDEGELDADTAAELAEVYEMTPGEEAEEEQLQEVAQRKKAVKKGRKKRKKTVEYVEGEYVSPIEGFSKEKMERLGKYVHDLSPVRRTDVQPPLNLLGKTRQDVLLYVLKDGTTQVWMKGSMTVTFEPTVKLPSWTIAHRYANRWRGLSPSGSVRGAQKEGEPPVKKSRLRTAVYAAVEGQDKLKKLEDPINIVEKRDRKLKRKQYDMPDLDKYELIGDRANPSARQRKKAKQWAVYHADHGINRKQMAYIKKFLSKSAPQGFFIKQFRFPKSQGLGTIPNAMWGPESGDAPVRESQVHYMDRAGRGWEDRMIDQPPRPVNYGQAIGIRKGNSFQLFTVYGGPLAPQNPADPGNQDVAGSKRFWKKHALSSHQWAKANPRRRKNITPPSRIPWEHANAAESLLAHRSTTGKSWSRGVRLYLGHIRNRDWEGKESNFEDYPEDSKKARRMLLREVDRIRKGGSPHLYKWAKANPPGEMGKWKKTADGYYLPGQAVSFLVKKEAIKARGRRKQMWALYANRHEDAREKGWKLWLNNIPTLTKAKGIARDYVGDDSGKKRNPRRRKNARWPEKIGRYKLKMQKSEGYGDDDATYGPFRIVHQVYVPSPSDWHARPQPDTWKVTLGDWDDPYTEYLGTYSSRDSAISTLRSHLREGRGRSPTKEYKYRVRVSIGPSGNLTEIGRKAALESLKRMGKPAKFSFVMESRWGRVKQAAESELERQTGHRWTLHGGKQGKGGSQVFEVYTSGWLGGTVTIEDAASKAAKGRIRTVARRENVAFGKGKPERNHPYANILRSEGLTYSHSVPVNHSGVKVFHHVYRLDGTDFYVSYYQEPLGTKWLWEGSVSGSGRMHQGFGMSKLNKYLRGAVPRHRTKAAREREAYEHSSAIMSGFSPPSPRRRR